MKTFPTPVYPPEVGMSAPITALETVNANLSILVRMAPPAGVGTNMLCAYDGTTIAVASATGAGAKAANCFVATHSTATTPFYGWDYTIASGWIPTGAIKGSLLYLGNSGAIAPDATTMGQGFSSIPDDAKFVQYDLTRADGTAVLYTYPVAKT